MHAEVASSKVSTASHLATLLTLCVPHPSGAVMPRGIMLFDFAKSSGLRAGSFNGP
jgi:hypothetical protein